jgi:hypothetical protein
MASTWEMRVMGYYHDKKTVRLMKQIMKEDRPFLLLPSELLMIHSLSKSQTVVPGDYAEVGVFKGATAKAICESKKKKHLHLFDTFEGLPKASKQLDKRYKSSMFRSNYGRVKKKLSKYKNVHLYKGLFPGTGDPVQDKKFAFVHLDVDLFESTKDSLEFFYPRMSKGGILLSHDYHAAGVKKAFNEFFKDRPEHVIPLPVSQCMITKR